MKTIGKSLALGLGSLLTLSSISTLACAEFTLPTFPDIEGNIENWRPNQFDILCGPHGGPINPDPQDTSCYCKDQMVPENRTCLLTDDEATYEGNLRLAAGELELLRFQSPDSFGPVINDLETDARKVRIYAAPISDATAKVYTVGGFEGCKTGALVRMTVDPSAIFKEPPSFTAYLAAHELYHTVQAILPEARKKNRHRRGECLRPRWINEAHADTFGIYYARQRFPRRFPASNPFHYEAMAGLRPYHQPLYTQYPESQKHIPYRTSSFWLHIADRYRNGDVRFLQDYQLRPAPVYADDKEDWLRWLDRNLLDDPKVRTPLYRVFPGFLTHFLGAWEKRGVGHHFSETGWIKQAFGGCIELTVSPEQPYAITRVVLKAMSGKCISVTVKGLVGTQLASVKLAAYTTRRHVDDLHMGYAYTNDRTGFNCGHAVRKNRIPRGKLECLLEPVTSVPAGSLDPDAAATRYWNGILVEPGFTGADPKTERDPAGSDPYLDPVDKQKPSEPAGSADAKDGDDPQWTITNKYALSLVPTEPSLEELENLPPVFMQIAAGLEVSGLMIEGRDVNQGGADGSRSSKRKRAVASAGPTALSTNIIAPPSTGYVDDDGLVFSDSLSRDLAEIREFTTQMQQKFAKSAGVETMDLRTFRLAEANVTPVGGSPIEEKIEVIREFTVIVADPLPEGVTGTFRSFVHGIDHETRRAFFSEGEEDVKVTVLENSRHTFHARVAGNVCEGTSSPHEFMARAMSGQRRCERRFTISGEIIKPFAYLYRADTSIVSRQTEGERLYNQYGPNRRDGDSTATQGDGSGAPPGRGAGTPTGASSAGTSHRLPCDCSCANRAIVERNSPECSDSCRKAWPACGTAGTSAGISRAVTPPESPASDEDAPVGEARRMASDMMKNMGMPLGVDVDKLMTGTREERKAYSESLRKNLLKKREETYQSTFGMSPEELEKLDMEERREVFRKRGGMKTMTPSAPEPGSRITHNPPPPMPSSGFPDGSKALPVSGDLTATLEYSSAPDSSLTMVAVDLARSEIVHQAVKSGPISEKLNLRHFDAEPADLLIELVDPESRKVVARFRPVTAPEQAP